MSTEDPVEGSDVVTWRYRRRGDKKLPSTWSDAREPRKRKRGGKSSAELPVLSRCLVRRCCSRFPNSSHPSDTQTQKHQHQPSTPSRPRPRPPASSHSISQSLKKRKKEKKPPNPPQRDPPLPTKPTKRIPRKEFFVCGRPSRPVPLKDRLFSPFLLIKIAKKADRTRPAPIYRQEVRSGEPGDEGRYVR